MAACLRQVGQEDSEVQLSSSEGPAGQEPDVPTDPEGWGGGERASVWGMPATLDTVRGLRWERGQETRCHQHYF